jgi:predicted dehydrogenase/threonine dehydrogenase-like Zn-dependent dehydrogenase
VRQVVQRAAGGPAEVAEVPRPVPGHAEVLVRTVSSVVSPGTERAVTELARASLLAKARARPDLVRQVVHKARAEGVAATTRALRERLAGDIQLGYSAAGVVVAAGPAASGLRPGQLVATGGAGSACHAEFQAVPRLLCTPVPQGVTAEEAAFATIASIPLHALRLARAGPGAKVVVIGLGLVGQLAARLAMAAGCDVAGIDPSGHTRQVAAGTGVLALDEDGDATTGQVRAWSRDRGADAVLVCAATRSAAPLARAPALCRDRAAIVVVGDVGLELSRTPFYQAELSLLFARSYGPGRYEPTYERQGVDYPAGQVRWTEGRNAEAVLDLLAAGRLRVTDLVTHRFEIDEAGEAYRLLARPEPCLAIQLSYPPDPAPDGPVRVRAPRATGAGRRLPADGHAGRSLGVGLIGAGSYAGTTLLPALRAAGFHRFVAVASASGLSALRTAERHGFEKAVSGAAAVTADPDVGVTVVATPHDSHEELTIGALAAGQHVWCEKPLALSEEGVDEAEKAWRESGRQLAVGFNRRWSPAVRAARAALAGVSGPRLLVYRVAAGEVPPGHWYGDPRHGGRIVGEVCHFVDTAAAIVGCDIEEADGLAGSGPADSGPGRGEVVVSLRFTDGSLAAICYGAAVPVAGKEWVEVSAGAHRVVIDDFRLVRANGRTRWRGAQDKGQRALAAAFYGAIHGGTPLPTEAMLASMRATIQAAAKANGHD